MAIGFVSLPSFKSFVLKFIDPKKSFLTHLSAVEIKL